MADFEKMSTAELVAYYNDYANEMNVKKVNRFATRADGMRRCAEMDVRFEKFQDEVIAQLNAGKMPAGVEPADADMIRDYGRSHCPSCGVHLSNGVGYAEDDHNKDAGMTHLYECLGCGEEFGPEIKVGTDEVRSAAIAKSWKDDEVKAKRSTRHHVNVDGKEYTSVRKAFVALQLPLNEHIAFRMMLKEAGTLEAYDMKWTAIEV